MRAEKTTAVCVSHLLLWHLALRDSPQVVYTAEVWDVHCKHVAVESDAVAPHHNTVCG